MDTGQHELADLFVALGLPADHDSIERFLRQHSLAPGLLIADAWFWNEAQAELLRTAISDDAEWAEAADRLATLLCQ
jgi:hypothetical protein